MTTKEWLIIMILLEINEFNPDLMQMAAEKLNASNLLKLLSLNRATTHTNDVAERHGLDPWVQWVSIHTGQPSIYHGIKHLGDVKNLKLSQVWEVLDDAGISYGIWGAMNARKGAGNNCKFFFPDPWTFSEDAYPEELNDLLALPRYYSKNYLELDKITLLKTALKLCRFIAKPSIFFELLKLAPLIASSLPANPAKNYFLFVLFDLINAQLFCTYYKRHRPDFALLFLNSLAHLQHHCWTGEREISKEMATSFLIFDRVIGLIFSIMNDDEKLLVTNAFSQRQSYGENEYLYRQINPQIFFQNFGINPVQTEQLMTNDSQLFFSSAGKAIEAAEILQAARLEGEQAFEAEIDAEDPLKVFCQFAIWKDIPDTGVIALNGFEEPFYKSFQKVVRRSGSHVSDGQLFSNREIEKKELYNHEIFQLILNNFRIC